MIAKIIVHARNRQEAVAKMQSALGEIIIEGIDTNVDYQYELIGHPRFASGDTDIEFEWSGEEKVLIMLCCVLLGVIYGFLISPIKKGISFGNNNGNNYNEFADDYWLDDEE